MGGALSHAGARGGPAAPRERAHLACLSNAAPVPHLDARGWAWGYLFDILHEIATTGAECTLAGLEAVHPTLLNLHWTSHDLAAYEQGEEWAPLLRWRLLEMLRVFQAFNSEYQNGRPRRDEDVHQPVLYDLARKISELTPRRASSLKTGPATSRSASVSSPWPSIGLRWVSKPGATRRGVRRSRPTFSGSTGLMVSEERTR